MNTLTDAEKAAGWKLLFDGKTTEGWRGYHKDKCPDGWQVIDGTLDRVKRSGDLVTVDKYSSFELVLDWRIAKAGNSGVMYHIVEDVDRPGFSGPEYQLLDNIDGEDPQRAGWCYALYQPPLDPATGKPLDTTHAVGQWNTSRILVNGSHVEHWMNGVKYVEYELWSDDWNQRVAKSKFAALPNFAKARTGYICLQDHGGEVAFRNIKLRPIVNAAAAGMAQPGSPAVVNDVRFFPAPKHEKAMVGGKITGSNVSASEGFTVLAEITTAPKAGEWTELTFPNTAPYRWVRYEAPPGSHGNVAEIEFYAGDRKLNGPTFGSPGAQGPGGNWKMAFDGKIETWFNSSDADGQYAGLDLGDQASTGRPVFVPPASDFADPQKIVLKSRTPGAVIRYTLDGTTPTPQSGVLYSGPIAIDKTTTLVAVAFKDGLACSPPNYGTWRIGTAIGPPVNSFHIGNSLTGNTARFPIYVRTIGEVDRYQSYLIGGALTVKLWNAKEGPDKERWEQTMAKVSLPLDLMTLQPRDFNVAEEADYDVKFIDQFREKSPDVQPWLYAEWVERDRKRPTDKGEVPSYEMSKVWPAMTWEESMSAMLLYNEEVQHQIFQREHAGKPVRVLPSDIALGWVRNMVDHGQIPGIAPGEASFYSTFFADQVHVNANGSYLVDLTWYAAFYRGSPVGCVLPVDTTLTAEQAAILQQLAWDVVKNYPDAGLYEEGPKPVEPPTCSPAPSEISDVTPITLASSTPGAWFRYTLDGTPPTRTRGYVYCGVISVRPGMKLSAIAFKSGMADSAVTQVEYPVKVQH